MTPRNSSSSPIPSLHPSFVRSVSMDKWTPEQIQKMQKGGNCECHGMWPM